MHVIRTLTRRPSQLAEGLFAGIVGIELGLGRSGFAAEMQCEVDEGAPIA
jgi:hypothetical protein